MTDYRQILSEELVRALGCTEPIAIALCAARARALLEQEPQRLEVFCSRGVIKNARSVIVPGTGGLAGIEVAAAAGAFAGNWQAGLQVLAGADPKRIAAARAFMETGGVKTFHQKEAPLLYIRVKAMAGAHQAEAEISGVHTHFSRLSKDDQVLLHQPLAPSDNDSEREQMSFEGILAYAQQEGLLEDTGLLRLLDTQIQCNAAIAEEGLRGDYGAAVGKTLLEGFPQDLKTRLRAYAAAGSDARMAGSPLPVVINAGSGNQGLTTSLPLIVYAREHQLPKERLYRALVMANLLAVYIKGLIGRLSAFCGVVSAAAAAGAALAWLEGFSHQQMGEVISCTLLTSGGILCDGAKASCATKIAVSLDNALMALEMTRRGRCLPKGQGLAGEDTDTTIRRVARVAREGMTDTDDLILQCMLESEG